MAGLVSLREKRRLLMEIDRSMDKKYGEISETLKEVRSDFKRLVTPIEEFLKERSGAP